jgi:hypothetical protein
MDVSVVQFSRLCQHAYLVCRRMTQTQLLHSQTLTQHSPNLTTPDSRGSCCCSTLCSWGRPGRSCSSPHVPLTHRVSDTWRIGAAVGTASCGQRYLKLTLSSASILLGRRQKAIDVHISSMPTTHHLCCWQAMPSSWSLTRKFTAPAPTRSGTCTLSATSGSRSTCVCSAFHGPGCATHLLCSAMCVAL